MKKLIILLIALLMFSPVLFTGCNGCSKENIGSQLSQPAYIEVITNEDNILLYTDKNPCATHYLFYICKKEETKNEISQYIPLQKTDKNYIDVTNEFINNQTYYFYVQTIDETSNLSKSIPSEIGSYLNTMKLNTPTITIQDDIINWNKIRNATSYEIIINDNTITITNELSFNVSSFNNGSLLQSNTVLNIKIKALALDSYYTESNFSNEVSYFKHLNPTTPVISLNNNKIILNNVLNAKSYEMKIMSLSTNVYTINAFTESQKEISLNNFYNLDTNSYVNLISEVGEYLISIRCKNNDYYTDYSNIVKVVTTKVLSSPTIISTTINSINNTLIVSVKNNDTISNSLHIEVDVNNQKIEKNIDMENDTIDIVFTLQELNLENINSIKGHQVKAYINGIGSYYLNSNSVTTIIN